MMVMVANQTNAEFCYWAGKFEAKKALGHLYSPGAQRGPYPFFPYALDNGAYPAWEKNLEWDEAGWRELLVWAASSGQAPLWALAPDVVADRERTIERWREFSPVVRAFGFRPAFALQDGMTFDDVPDAECMLFLGGTTGWKDAAIEPWCKQFPGRVHVGRVNRTRRLMACWYAGAASVDGTGWWHKKNGQRAELEEFLTLVGREPDTGE